MGLGSLFGGGDTSKAVEKAGTALWQGNAMYNKGMNEAQTILQRWLANASNYLQPYYQTGTNALAQYAGALGVNVPNYGGIPGWSGVQPFDPTQMVLQTPGYQFGKSQGEDALNAQLTAQGLSGSGPGREAAIKFGQNYGMQYYNDLMNRLAGLASSGQSAGTQIGSWGMDTGKSIANIEGLMATNAQNTQATIAGLNLQSAIQQAQSNPLGDILGSVLGLVTAPLSGGTSLLGMGANYLSNLFGGGGGGGGNSISFANQSPMTGANIPSNFLQGLF